MKKTITFLKMFTFVSLILLSSCTYKNTVTEIDTLDTILKQIDYFDQNSLIIFDVDETLITPTDDFFHIKNKLFNFILWSYYAIKTFDLFLKNGWWYYNTALYSAQFKLMDTKTPALIKALQDRNIKVIALTSCPTGKHEGNAFVLDNIEDWRINQLKTVGFDFSNAFPKQSDIVFTKLNKEYPPLFKNGILFCNGYTRKGIVLKAFLQKLKWKPQSILSIDDTLKDCINIKKEMDTIGIDCKVFQYTAEKKFLKDVKLRTMLYQMKRLIENEAFVPSNTIPVN